MVNKNIYYIMALSNNFLIPSFQNRTLTALSVRDKVRRVRGKALRVRARVKPAPVQGPWYKRGINIEFDLKRIIAIKLKMKEFA